MLLVKESTICVYDTSSYVQMESASARGCTEEQRAKAIRAMKHFALFALYTTEIIALSIDDWRMWFVLICFCPVLREVAVDDVRTCTWIAFFLLDDSLPLSLAVPLAWDNLGL